MKSPFFHILLACSLCIAAIAGYGYWYTVIGDKSTAVANLESQIVAKNKTADHIASVRASLAEIADDEAIMQNYFVPETGVVAFITNLEGQGHTQGTAVNVNSVSMSSVGAQPTLTFSVTIKGTFDAVMRTVGAIEYSPYDLSISTFSFGHDDKNSWIANLGLVVGSVSASSTARTP